MRNALVIVIVCVSVSLLYDVYKENRHRSQTDSRKKVCRPLMMDA